MDKTNTILFHWDKEQKNFDKNLSILKKKPGKAEAILKLRVTVKKFSAYLHLYRLLQQKNLSLPGGDEQMLIKTSELYEIIGRHRDVEICIELIVKLKKEKDFSCSKFDEFLKTVLKMTRDWSHTAIHHYRNKELRQIKSILKQDKQLYNKEIVNKKIESIIKKELTVLPLSSGKPHQLRINLKSIHYAISLLREDEKYQPQLLDEIIDDLGNWQNMEELERRLKHFRKDYLPESLNEYQTLKGLEPVIELKKKTIIRTVRSKTRRWLKAVMSSQK